jgi:hypothetical protein
LAPGGAVVGSGEGSGRMAQVVVELGESARERVWEMLLGMVGSRGSGGAEQEMVKVGHGGGGAARTAGMEVLCVVVKIACKMMVING